MWLDGPLGSLPRILSIFSMLDYVSRFTLFSWCYEHHCCWPIHAFEILQSNIFAICGYRSPIVRDFWVHTFHRVLQAQACLVWSMRKDFPCLRISVLSVENPHTLMCQPFDWRERFVIPLTCGHHFMIGWTHLSCKDSWLPVGVSEANNTPHISNNP